MINKLSPSTNVSPANASVQFSWVSDSATSLYQIKYRKINEATWSDTGRITKSFAANATATHTLQVTLSPNETYEWRVRVWNGASGAMSDWSPTETFNTQYDAIGTMKVKVSDSQYEDIRIISPDANAGQERLMVKMTDNQIGQVDTVLSGTGASSVKIKINSTTVKSLVKNMPKVDRTSYSNHTNTAVNGSGTPYSAYSNHTNSGYTQYSNRSNSGYSAYDNHSDSGYRAYSNHSNYSASYTDSHGYDNAWIGADYSQSGYSAYSNHYNSGYSVYDNHYNGGYSAYSNHSQSGYSKYSNHNDN